MKPVFLALALSIAASAAAAECTVVNPKGLAFESRTLSRAEKIDADNVIAKLTTSMALSQEAQRISAGSMVLASDSDGLWQLALQQQSGPEVVVARTDTYGVTRANLLEKPAEDFRAGVQKGLLRSLAEKSEFKVRVQGACWRKT